MRMVVFVIPGLGLPVHGFGLMMLLACVGALYLTAWRARRESINPDVVFELALWLLSGGFIGARLLYVIQHHETIRTVWDVARVWQGGNVYYGCIAGGLVGSLIYWARKPFPFWAMADAVAPALALGSAVGRIGCWLNGCCYGDPCRLPWAVRFPAGTLPWIHHASQGLIAPSALESLPIHPTQLYAALDGLVVLALLTAYYPLRRRDGEVMALLMVTYPVTRFLVEMLRDDEGADYAGLTLSQAISVGLFAGGLFLWFRLSRQPLGRHVDRAGTLAAAITTGPSPARATRPRRDRARTAP